MKSGVENVAANSNQKLTDSELDALLEAARASVFDEWFVPERDAALIAHQRYCTIELVYKDGRFQVQVKPFIVGDIPVANFIAAANPATIERLVLMVRAQDTVWRTAVKERDAAAEALGKHYEELEIRAVEHFRARAFRAIEELEIDATHDHFYLNGYYRAKGDAKHRIESLPLVEKEEDQ